VPTPKGGLLAALGKAGGEDEESEPSDVGVKARAAKDVLRAVKSGDASALSAALERHYSACGMGSDDEAY
jgi:hypothetical protein